ncbi:hypothetical protein CU098_003906, partial [Rhizopus stolonifer]
TSSSSSIPSASSPPQQLPSASSLVSFSTPIISTRKELHHYPQVKLKNLQWQKLDAKLTEQTIWDMKENEHDTMEQLLNEKGAFEKLETMFPAKVNTFLEKKQLKVVDAKKNDTVVRFLTKEKNKNINIAILPKIKHFGSYKQVAQHIMMVDDKLCTEIFLINLITYLPTRDDDMVLMQKYVDGPEEECQKLDLPEQFIVEMMRMYRVQFWDKFEQLRKSLSVVLSASDSLRHSRAFKDLLLVILLLGNYMNASSVQGGAFGMKIGSINKLMDTKASEDSKLTLLHVLIGFVRREMPSTLHFIDDLKDIPEATRVMASITDIIQQYTDLRQGLKQLNIELDRFWRPKTDDIKEEGEENNDGEKDRFLSVMEEYQSSAVGRFEELEALYVNVDVKWKEVMTFYGDNPRTKRPDEFFGVIAQFLQSWKIAAAEELNYTKQKELEEKRLREMEEKRRKAMMASKRSSGSDTLSSLSEDDHEDRRLMDDLLEKLRSGETEKKLRQRRVRQRLRSLRNEETLQKSEKRSSNTKPLPTRLDRSVSISSTASSGHMLVISAEDLLRSLQQEDE